MAGRGPQSFQKRQKEMQRKEKQQEKAAKRQQRKEEKQNSPAGAGPEIDYDYEPLPAEPYETSEVKP